MAPEASGSRVVHSGLIWLPRKPDSAELYLVWRPHGPRLGVVTQSGHLSPFEWDTYDLTAGAYVGDGPLRTREEAIARFEHHLFYGALSTRSIEDGFFCRDQESRVTHRFEWAQSWPNDTIYLIEANTYRVIAVLYRLSIRGGWRVEWIALEDEPTPGGRPLHERETGEVMVRIAERLRFLAACGALSALLVLGPTATDERAPPKQINPSADEHPTTEPKE